MMGGFPSQCMAVGDVEVVVVGIAQDGGVPKQDALARGAFLH